MAETWIVFKTKDMSAEGWEERLLMPSGDITNILEENWDCSGQDPQIGDRVREYISKGREEDFATQGRDGDWVVAEMHRFSSPDTDQKIIVCYCEYQPIEAEWEPLKRFVPSEAEQVLQGAGV